MSYKYRKSSRRKSSRKSLSSLILTFVLLGCFWVANTLTCCNNPEPEMQQVPGEYGNLMKVVTNPDVPSQLKSYTGMDVSFNADCHIPNWVSWELTEEKTNGTVPRGDEFFVDPEIKGCAYDYDYRGSGYDRGHMAPAGDMKWSQKAMDECFSFANMCPQLHSLNNGSWKSLEEKCRTWAQIDGKIYIVCGPIMDDTPLEYIGDSKVWVPRRFFKVIIAPYSTPARGIGFIMPNGTVVGGMQNCAVSIDEVEKLTGHDFFSTLPDDVEEQIESQCNFHQWSTLKK